MALKLVRGYTDLGTFGKIYDDAGKFVCYSMERPWQNNVAFKSCIPEGEYLLVRHDSPKYGECYALTGGSVSLFKDDAYQRYGILIHPANWPSQLSGCIAPGASLGVIDAKPRDWAVLSSANALKRLENVIADQEAKAGENTVQLIITHGASEWQGT